MEMHLLIGLLNFFLNIVFYELISKFNIGLKTLLREGRLEPEFDGDFDGDLFSWYKYLIVSVFFPTSVFGVGIFF